MFKQAFIKFNVIKSVVVSILLALIMCETAYSAGQHKLPSGEVLNDPTRPYNWNKASGPKAKQKHFALNYILKTPQRTNATVSYTHLPLPTKA